MGLFGLRKKEKFVIDENQIDKEEYFGKIVRDNLNSVYSFVYRIVGDTSDADDITQETFVKVWKNLSKYDKNKSFKSWLFTIAHNTAVDWLRKKKSIVFSSFEDDEGKNYFENSLPDPEPLADEIFSKNEEVSSVKKYILELPSFYQEVLFLYYDQDMTFEEIGNILGKSLNTVKSQHRRAILKLKEKMS